MKTVFLTWQDHFDRARWPVGKLTYEEGRYRFAYTRGAKKSPRFMPFDAFPKLDVVYESVQLFPLFANRLLTKRRPEYPEYVEWLNLPSSEQEPIAMLARSGGERATDSLEIFPCPEPDEQGQFQVQFFVRGIKHMLQPAVDEYLATLQPGTPLLVMSDFQNVIDPLAVALRSLKPVLIVGYCPRYLTDDFYGVLGKSFKSISVVIERVNLTAPSQLRLLCRLTADWPSGFVPCNSEIYQPYSSQPAATPLSAYDPAPLTAMTEPKLGST